MIDARAKTTRMPSQIRPKRAQQAVGGERNSAFESASAAFIRNPTPASTGEGPPLSITRRRGCSTRGKRSDGCIVSHPFAAAENADIATRRWVGRSLPPVGNVAVRGHGGGGHEQGGAPRGVAASPGPEPSSGGPGPFA